MSRQSAYVEQAPGKLHPRLRCRWLSRSTAQQRASSACEALDGSSVAVSIARQSVTPLWSRRDSVTVTPLPTHTEGPGASSWSVCVEPVPETRYSFLQYRSLSRTNDNTHGEILSRCTTADILRGITTTARSRAVLARSRCFSLVRHDKAGSTTDTAPCCRRAPARHRAIQLREQFSSSTTHGVQTYSSASGTRSGPGLATEAQLHAW